MQIRCEKDEVKATYAAAVFCKSSSESNSCRGCCVPEAEEEEEVHRKVERDESIPDLLSRCSAAVWVEREGMRVVSRLHCALKSNVVKEVSRFTYGRGEEKDLGFALAVLRHYG